MDGRLQRAVGLNLRAYRGDLGLSQEAFADVLGVHRTYLGGIERGEHNLTLRSVERIAAKLHVDPVVLMRADRNSSGGRRREVRG
ncbi:MAG TPA: helix-turn-helix transcriptional regulator [Solirubrobacteraceae bacterium]|nr:helix-turn-helix transcriptional regulator [Solirubrobacteraceae bacterium]